MKKKTKGLKPKKAARASGGHTQSRASFFLKKKDKNKNVLKQNKIFLKDEKFNEKKN